jgi:hypothetical protein
MWLKKEDDMGGTGSTTGDLRNKHKIAVIIIVKYFVYNATKSIFS